MLPDLFQHDYLNRKFWGNVIVGHPNACWEWVGCKDKRGYGRFTLRGKLRQATRLVLFPPLGESFLNACHSCDNPSCVNPNHLFAGTYQDNTLDMIQKGRHRFGSNRPSSE